LRIRFWRRQGETANRIHTDWARYIFQFLFAEIAKSKVELPGGVLLDSRRYADAPRLGKRFEARRNVDAVTEDVAVFSDNIALMDAYPKIDPTLRSQTSVALTETGLDFKSTPQRIDSTGEYGEKSVTHRLNDATIVRSTTRVDQFEPDRPKPLEGALLVHPHQARVAGNIGGKNCCETASGGSHRN
jgi:hypothetical protein